MIHKTPDASQIESLAANTFIDLFAGCGGLSLGLMLAGWRGIFAVEKDPFAFETLRHNLLMGTHIAGYDWPDWLPTAHADVAILAKQYRDQLRALRGKITLIAGGPPCQGYSLAGKRQETDSRNTLFHRYIEVVDDVRPAFLLLENVRGIEVEFDKEEKAKAAKGGEKKVPLSKPFSEQIAEAIAALDYHVYADLVKVEQYGVAQTRERYILFAVHKCVLPDKNALAPFRVLSAVRPDFLKSKGLPADRVIGSGEAISDLESAGGRELVTCVDEPRAMQVSLYEWPQTAYQVLLHRGLGVEQQPNSLRLPKHGEVMLSRYREVLNTCRPGARLSDQDRERIGIRRRCLYLLDRSKPSPTITTVPDDILHYSEPRILTVRECARLQSFPDWFEFKGPYTTGGERRAHECPRYTQVGNAVPPFLAESLGMTLQKMRLHLLASLGHVTGAGMMDSVHSGTRELSAPFAFNLDDLQPSEIAPAY